MSWYIYPRGTYSERDWHQGYRLPVCRLGIISGFRTAHFRGSAKAGHSDGYFQNETEARAPPYLRPPYGRIPIPVAAGCILQPATLPWPGYQMQLCRVRRRNLTRVTRRTLKWWFDQDLLMNPSRITPVFTAGNTTGGRGVGCPHGSSSAAGVRMSGNVHPPGNY